MLESMKKLVWTGVIGALVAAVAWGVIAFIEPRSVRLIKLSPFESPQVVANSIWLRMQEKLKSKPILFWGVWPEETFVVDSLRAFIANPTDGVKGYDEVWVDEPFHEILPGRKIFLQGQTALKKELTEATQQGKRILIVTTPVYAATNLPGSPAWSVIHKEQTEKSEASDLGLNSLIFSDLPRRREQEVDMKIPCVLPHNDKTGVGALGCQILQVARPQYRKVMVTGTQVGLLEQISSYDYLFLMGREP